MPSASGLSGPTTVKSQRVALAKASNPGKSSALRLTHSTGAPFLTNRSAAMPALPGAQQTFSDRGDLVNFQTNACSRPPEPTTRIFMDGIESGIGPSAKRNCAFRAGLLPRFVYMGLL